MAVEAGFDPVQLPPDRFFNWVWSVLMKNRDEKGRMEVELEIYRPLPGQSQVTSGPWSEEEMAASFRSAAAHIS